MEFENDQNQAAQNSAGIHFEQEKPCATRIKVIGVGGGGSNAVSDMVCEGFTGVEFYAVNTDYQALENCKAPNKIQIGAGLTNGLGAGASPEIGEKAAREAETELRAMLQDADMVFITAGMGGGTGTGAGPVIAELAREMGILNVAIVTKPFTFEGPQRMRRAQGGIAKLNQHVDTMIVILNDKLMETVGANTALTEAFGVANGVLAQGILAISDLISKPGLINVDFCDVRTIMGVTGGAVMGVGIGKGENRASQAVKKACHSPLQEKIVIDGARGILINITGGSDITMKEIHEATQAVYETADEDANVIFGVVVDDKMEDEMRVTIIATGFDQVIDESCSARPGAHHVKPGGARFEAKPREVQPVAAKPEPEPDPEPAINRKREQRDSGTLPVHSEIDFGSDENPLNRWEEGGKPAEARPAPAENSQAASQTAPKASAAAPVMNDRPAHGSAQPTPPPVEGEDDPYAIPAIERRRKQRFFE